MRVGFNARLLASPSVRGWNRYTINLLCGLKALGTELVLYGDAPLHSSHRARLDAVDGPAVAGVISPRMPYAIWEQGWLPIRALLDRVSVLHSPFNFGLPAAASCPCVLTLHDAIGQAGWPTLSGAGLVSWARHRAARERADHVIAVSEHARAEIVVTLGMSPADVSVIYEAADARFNRYISESARILVREKYVGEAPYVLYVGGWEKRKNVAFLVDAFARANLVDVTLVLAGGGEDDRADVAALVGRAGVAQRVRLLSWVDDDDLPALYAEAMVFVYPSLQEGFGLQLLEAMSVGCPLFAADASSFPEVVGTGGELFPLRDSMYLAELLKRASADRAYRAALSARGWERAKAFSWRGTAEATLAVYRLLAGGEPTPQRQTDPDLTAARMTSEGKPRRSRKP